MSAGVYEIKNVNKGVPWSEKRRAAQGNRR